MDSSTPNTTARPAPPNVDPLLFAFVRLANGETFEGAATGAGVTMGITLALGGTLIAGTLIGRKEYASTLGNLVASAIDGLPGETAIDLSASFDKFGDKPSDDFLHLKDATVWQGESRIPSAQSLWRIRIARVDGFLLGVPQKD